MMRFQSKNKKSALRRNHLHKSVLSFNPFDMRDTKYLEHLNKELKLRSSREAMTLLRKDMIESNNRANFQGEVDKIKKRIRKT